MLKSSARSTAIFAVINYGMLPLTSIYHFLSWDHLEETKAGKCLFIVMMDDFLMNGLCMAVQLLKQLIVRFCQSDK